MKSIKVILAGIVVILASLFFMGICILNYNHKGGPHPEGFSLGLFIFGIIICVIGLFLVRDYEYYGDDEEDEEEENDNEEE